MIVGIIGAMENEIKEIKGSMKDLEIKKILTFEFYLGKIENVNVILVKCLEGKVNAAICTQTLIQSFKVDLILNVGLAGGISKKLSIGGVAISKDTVEFDLDTTAINYELGYVFGLGMVKIPCDEKTYELLYKISSEITNTVLGTIGTSDKFISSSEDKKMLTKKFNVIASDMESSSINHVCKLNGISFCSIRAISDNGDGREYKKSANDVTVYLNLILNKFLKSYIV